MRIEKDGRAYIVTETAKQWNVKTDASKMGVSYNIPKEVCGTFDDLKKYIAENELFYVP